MGTCLSSYFLVKHLDTVIQVGELVPERLGRAYVFLNKVESNRTKCHSR